MSIISSSLVILLLSIAICSCNARPIGVINKDNDSAKSFHLSSKNEEKSSLARISISSTDEKPSKANKYAEPAQGDQSPLMENGVHKNNKGTRTQQKLVEKKHDQVKDDDHVAQNESLAKVSWKLPHRKRGEQQPGFNLDYAPPKIHPPVHN
ncbi:hypothetical protein ACH5RR_023859 [Cinchona calisaya]|uniref:Uncharacterized protein n=1 Tax=Cinchona calisaya TaxID=153742 RepID=A0ABD2ZBT9_9GENT